MDFLMVGPNTRRGKSRTFQGSKIFLAIIRIIQYFCNHTNNVHNHLNDEDFSAKNIQGDKHKKFSSGTHIQKGGIQESFQGSKIFLGMLL